MNWLKILTAVARNPSIRAGVMKAGRALVAQQSLALPEDVLTDTGLLPVQPGGYYVLVLDRMLSVPQREALEERLQKNLGIRISIVAA